jgi:four helix bundle protein
MGARHFNELICWQLARELRREVVRLSMSPALSRDFGLRDQIRDAASSVCANIAEGFGRFSHREFIRFLEIARGSLNEVEDRLTDVEDRGYVCSADLAVARNLHQRTNVAICRLTASLREGSSGIRGRRNPAGSRVG